MTNSDHDNAWTFDESDVQHMKASEITLDSGADGQRLRFVDAQGSPLNISSTPVATVDFGGFSLTEEFIVTSITSPLLHLVN